MLPAAETAIRKWLLLANPWWENGKPDPHYDQIGPEREFYLELLLGLIQGKLRRTVIAMGPRRVGKTVLMQHCIRSLLAKGIPPHHILYASVDHPLFTGMTLEELFGMFREMHGHSRDAWLYVFIDEIQYHPDWARHLKALHDVFPNVRFVASGSAAAALRMQSEESGAGRFIDVLIPPLSFLEFIEAKKLQEPDMNETSFAEYINFGGFPEAIKVGGYDRFIAESIIDKVLLHDLPHLYGIEDPQELKRFFVYLAYNVGREVGLDGLSKSSGVAKNTVRKYLDYLEAAFLIHRLQRVDENARHFQRQTHFKVYLVNTSMRAALFGPMEPDEPEFSFLVENALLAQLIRSEFIHQARYARWKDGEIDIVLLDRETQMAAAAIEVKWTKDQADTLPSPIAKVLPTGQFGQIHIATRSPERTSRTLGDRTVHFAPAWRVAISLETNFVMPFLLSGERARPLLALLPEEQAERLRLYVESAKRLNGVIKALNQNS